MTGKTPAQIQSEINALFPDNSSGQISAAAMRTVTTDLTQMSLNQVLALSGTGVACVPANLINVSDNVAVTASNTDVNGNFTPEGWYNVSGLQVNWTGSGANATGARAAILGNVFFNSASNVGNTANFYASEILTCNIYSDDNGTVGTPKGVAYGLASVTYLKSTVKHWNAAWGAEFDLVCEAGSSTAAKIGVGAYLFTGDAVQGAVIDTGFMVAALAGTPGFRFGYQVGSGTSSPLSADGTAFGTFGSFTATNAIDVSSASWTGYLFKSGPLKITGAGLMTLSANAAGTTLPAGTISGSLVGRFVGLDASPARLVVDSFGTGTNTAFSTNNMRRANGTLLAPTAVQSGNLLFGYVGTGYGTSSFLDGGGAGMLGWASETFTNNGPVTTGNGGTELGFNVTANGTISNAEALRLLNTGQVKFTGAANFSANAAIATALGSVGPAGSHTTVQEWLTFQNASGVTRYVPCF